jgi:hypothetical protein
MISWVGQKTVDGSTYLANVAAQVSLTLGELFRLAMRTRGLP